MSESVSARRGAEVACRYCTAGIYPKLPPHCIRHQA